MGEGLQEAVGQSGGTCCPSRPVARKRGPFMPTQHLSPLGCGSQQVGGDSEREKGAVLGSPGRPRSWELGKPCVLLCPSGPCWSPGLGASTGLVSHQAAQAGLGGWPLLPDRPT